MAAIGYLLGESAVLELPKTIGRLGGTVCLILDDFGRVADLPCSESGPSEPLQLLLLCSSLEWLCHSTQVV